MNKPLFPDVTVNGAVIAQADIAAEAQNHAAPAGKPGIAWRKAARALVIRALLLQEAARQGLAAEPRELAPGRFESAEEASVRALLEAAVQTAAPSTNDLRKAYDADPARFRTPPLWETSHILCACDPGDAAASAKARRRAARLIATLRHDPRGFARLAAAESDCDSRAAGGALGQLGPGDCVPEFEAALAQLNDGEITAEPVLSRHGWHVIRLDALAEGRVLPFEAVRDRLSDALQKRAWATQARRLTAELVATAEITGVAL